MCVFCILCKHLDSNQGPVVYKTTALPTELCLHGLNIAHVGYISNAYIYIENLTQTEGVQEDFADKIPNYYKIYLSLIYQHA